MPAKSTTIRRIEAPGSETQQEGAFDQLCINTIRTLAMDAVQQANSGHPGTPMALAPLVYTIWQNFLRFDPEDPIWPNRDRFVLSNGHASMLLYAMLHLSGVKAVNAKYERLGEPAVSLDDIKRFRQLGSKCPGHPEYHLTSGVETTTGPLGQGCGNSVGMALAGRWLAQHFNRPDFAMFDYDVYVDMRRRRHDGGRIERSGLARRSPDARKSLLDLRQQPRDDRRPHGSGFQRRCRGAFPCLWLERAARRRCQRSRSGCAEAIEIFRRTNDVPTLIIVDSHIGYGAPHKHDTSAAHGEPLGEEEIRLAKRSYGWPEDAKFLVPDGVREHFRDGIGQRGQSLHKAWLTQFEVLPKSTSRSRRRDRAHAAARASGRIGTPSFRFSPPTPKVLPRATRPARCSTPSRRITLG